MISRLKKPDENGGNRTLLVVSVMLATLMQALDTTIANVALPDMQGSLSATQDQVSWVLTSYIVAAAILTPVTGWLAGRLGRRRLLIIAVGGFTVASLLCGIASGIGEMVFYRILQGVFGASLVPISQSLLLDSFPKEKHGAAMAMWGMGIMIGPILGPPLGGFLTQNYSWHWVFLINLPIGILALIGIMASVKKDVPHERKLDGVGLGLLALGIGALQLFLDRGQGEDWFGSLEIQIEAALALLALWGYGLWWWNKREHALLDLSLLKNGNFAVGCALIFIVGIVLFATLALLPPYLSTLMNYPVLTIGLVLAPRGVGTMFTMMLVGRMLGRVDARIPILVGMGLMVLSLHGMTEFGPTASMSSIIWLGVIQGMGLGLVFVPISTVAYATLEPHQRTEAAGLFSLVRNIGSSVGISVVMTLLSRALQINHAEIGSRIPAFGAELAALPSAWNPATTTGAALLNAEVMKQSAAIGYLNDFKLMMLLTLASMPLVLFMQSGKSSGPSDPGADAAAAH